MFMKLHEIELFANNPDNASEMFSSVLGLKMNVDQKELKVFDCGVPGIDLNISKHYPANKVSLSFLVKDIDDFEEIIKKRNIELNKPFESHLGLRAIILADNDVCRIVIHSPTEASPEWLRKMI